MNNSKLKIALLGCGQIADAHLQEIRKISFANLVAVCDTHRDLAEQAAARFEVPGVFTDLHQMIETSKPDVIHITTPAHTHATLTKMVLEAGCHAYVEKPFTVNSAEARNVITLADQLNKFVCVGHDQLFDHSWLRLKKRIDRKEIGIVKHVQSLLIYPLSGQFGSQVTSDSNHWVRKLPGGLFQNTISHPLYRITDYLLDEAPVIHAHAFSSRPELTFPTELRVSMIGKEVTGSLTFLTTVKPARRITWVYGTKGSLEIDFDSQTIKRMQAPRLPGAFQKLDDPWRDFTQAGKNFGSNFWRFLSGDIHYFAGMQELFRRFYLSIMGQGELPISHQEIIRVTDLMDQIFEQCQTSETLPTGIDMRYHQMAHQG